MRYYLELVEDGHMKYYKTRAVGNTAVFHWGRIGTAGQAKIFNFSTNSRAEEYVSKKVEEKLRKGYEMREEMVRVRA